VSAPAGQAPFLDADPPPWAARSFATILLLLFGITAIALVVVKVPETIAAAFVLAPVRGADPVRTLHDGIVAQVNIEDAQTVQKGAPLFVVASEPVGDRMAERQTLGARLSGVNDRLGNERRKFDNQHSADQQERQRLTQRATNLEKQIELKQQQATLLQDIAERQKRSFDEGVGTWMDASKQKLEADRLAVDIEQLKADLTDTRNGLSRLTFEMASRQAEFAEVTRDIREQSSAYRVRKGVLDQERSREGNTMTVEAPCAGTIVKLLVRSPGAVVHQDDVLAEVVCQGERLQAELLLPERGMAIVRTGQPVKLLYDAFPYERYGAQYGTLRWVSPASTSTPSGPAFRALADLNSDSVGVQGLQRPVLPGMSGRAAVIVGRRSLASYALEPLRQMRESLATGPRR
jgi:membrane fusion protein